LSYKLEPQHEIHKKILMTNNETENIKNFDPAILQDQIFHISQLFPLLYDPKTQ